VTSRPPCAACLGSHVCWVCDGRGHEGDQQETSCRSCKGTRVCAYCLSVSLEGHAPRRPAPSEDAAPAREPRER
jgi:hypothetical protein